MEVKSGQVSLFLVLGLMILMVLGFFLIGLKEFRLNSANTGSTIHDYVEQCVRKSAERGLYIIGRQGGWIKINAPFENMRYGNISYAYTNKTISLPPLRSIQAEHELFVERETLICLGSFPNKDAFFESIGIPIAHTKFTEKSVVVDVEMDVIAKIANGRRQFNDFSVTIPVRFKSVHTLANAIAERKKFFPSYVDLTLLGMQDIDVDVLSYGRYEVYVLTDKESSLWGLPYRFIFASELE
ncbi:MAG: hypothetical protein QXK37_02045 [Candidatus Woesearchaeota archaeon]